MRKKLFSAILVITGSFLLAACQEAPQQSTMQKPVAISAAAVQYANVPGFIEAPGSVQPRDRVALSSQINGFVRAVQVKAGDRVKAGQVLVTLDARDAESQKAAAQAGMQEALAAREEARKAGQIAASMRTAASASKELASQTFARYQKLFDARSVSPQELDEMRARRDGSAAELAARELMAAAAEDRLHQIEAKIAQARAQSARADVVVGWTVIQAPWAGMIAEKSVDPGSAIFPGSPLLVLESSSNAQVLATLPTSDLGRIRQGLEVQIRRAESKSSVTGKIAEIIPVSNPAMHSVQFKIDLPAGVGATSGEYVKVLIPSGDRQAILVSRGAVREAGQLTGVFIVDNASKARFRLVKIAPYDAERVEILSGADPGEKIVTNPNDHIVDGLPLEIRL
jgi:multidrug efflux pump subunit AcrA (membrane-fusion protein)